jgi:hypothetical protein
MGKTTQKKATIRATILMCYFHVVQNIKKHKNLMFANKFDDLLEDIQIIHLSHTKKLYKSNLLDFEKKHATVNPEMYNYIKDQWIDSDFCRWQSFRNLPGYANTNSKDQSL